MTVSKTFKSPVSHREVRVWQASDGVALAVLDDDSNESISTQASPSDAPALMLAIGEAAYPEVQGRPNRVHYAIGALLEQVEEDGFKAAEAQAELEAEAQCLRDAFAGEMKTELEDFSTLNSHVRDRWLAVARRAREMRAEK